MRILKIIAVLSITGIFSGAVLAGAFQNFNPLIQEKRRETLKKAIFEVLPEAKKYKIVRKNGLTLYEGSDAQGDPVGIAFEAVGSGYQGKIRMMVGLDDELRKIRGMVVMEQVETPGLGGKIEEAKFQNQFGGLEIRPPKIEYVKNMRPEKPNQIEAITGATISSRAVVETINQSVKRVLEVGK